MMEYSEYWDDVESLADDLEDMIPDEQYPHDLIHERVDSSRNIFIGPRPLSTIAHSDHEPTEYWREADTWSVAVSTAAYECMYHDVVDELQTRGVDV